MKKTVSGMLLVSLLAGCAINPTANPNYSLIDPKGVDMAKYQQDYAECAALANQSDQVANAAAGAVVVGIFGAIIGGLIAGREGARIGAGLGATQGAAAGAVGAANNQANTLRGCLAGRGYSIIR